MQLFLEHGEKVLCFVCEQNRLNASRLNATVFREPRNRLVLKRNRINATWTKEANLGHK